MWCSTLCALAPPRTTLTSDEKRNRISFCLLLQLISMSIQMFRRQIIYILTSVSVYSRARAFVSLSTVIVWAAAGELVCMSPAFASSSRFHYPTLWCLFSLLLFACFNVWLARHYLPPFGSQLIASWTRQMKCDDLLLLWRLTKKCRAEKLENWSRWAKGILEQYAFDLMGWKFSG